MPQKVNIPISMGRGLDTKTDAKQLELGTMVALQNAIFQTPKELRKRGGFTPFTQNLQGGGTISKGLGIAAYNNELTLMDGSFLYSYNASGPNWVNKGQLPLCEISSQVVIENSGSQTNCDSATTGALTCYTWTDSSGGVRCTVIDQVTGQSIFVNQLVASGATRAVVRAAYASFYIIYLTSTNLVSATIPFGSPTAIGSPFNITSYAPLVFDAMVNNNGTLYCAFSGSTSTTNSVASISIANAVTTVNYTVHARSISAMGIWGDTSSNVYVAYDGQNGSSVKSLNYAAFNSTLVQSGTEIVVDAAFESFENSLAVQNVTGVFESVNSYIHYEILNPPTTNDPLYQNYLKQATVSSTGTVNGPEFYCLGMGLGSKAFLQGTNVYFLGVNQSTDQTTYFLFKGNTPSISSASNFVNYISGKISFQNAGQTLNTGTQQPGTQLAQVTLLGLGVFQVATLYKDDVEAIGGVITTNSGVINSTINFFAQAPSKVVLGDNLLVCSGLLQMYDGAQIVEHGYNVFPENIQTALTTGGGTATGGGGGIGVGNSGVTIGQKQYSATYEWPDNQGQVHRSAPSIPVNVQLNQLAPITGFTGTLTASSADLTLVNNPAALSAGQYIWLFPNSANGGSPMSAFQISQLNVSPCLRINSISGTTVVMNKTIASGFTTGVYSFVVSNNPYAYMVFNSPDLGSTVLTGTANSLEVSQQFNGGTAPFFANVIIGQQIYNEPFSPFPSGTYITDITGTPGTGGFAITLSEPTYYVPLTATGGAVAIYIPIFDTGAITLQVPTLRATQKQNAQIVIYATTFDGENFFRVGSVANNPQVDFITFTDTTGDLFLEGNNELYTTGGVLENIEVAAPGFITTYKSRAIVKPSETLLEWEYSQQVVPGSPVEFNDALIQNVDSKIINLTAAGELDEKLILFGPNTKWLVTGDGPSSSGLNNDFIYPQKLTGTTGCQNQASLIEIPQGLIYQDANKGIYLLDRSLQEQYIGAQVEQYNAQTVTAAVLVPGFEMIRLTLNNGVVLTYDYITMQWSTDAYVQNIEDACVFENEFCYVGPTGLVLSETPSAFSDNGAYIPMALTTGWINVDDIEGFFRFNEIQIFGTWFSAHTLTVNIFYDFNMADTQQIIIPVPVNPQYGYKFRIKPAKQKCTSIQIQIIESGTGVGQGFSLSGLTFRVAVKVGLNKLPAAVSY